jgi:branched-subunit amino acid permease
MTTMEIFMACMGFIFCTVLLPLICVLMMLVVWWRIKTGKEIDIDSSEWEEE